MSSLRLVVGLPVAAGLALVLGSCSGRAVPEPPTDASGTTSAVEGDARDRTALAAECPRLLEQALVFSVGVQVLAQMRTPEQYELVRDGTLAFDPADMAAAITALRVLEPIDVGLGSVHSSLDRIEIVNDVVAQNLASGGEPTEDELGEYAAVAGDIASFIGLKLPVNAALDDLDCPES